MIRLLTIVDTETTSLEPDAVCIEVAVAQYSVPHAAVLTSFSSLIRHDTNAAEAVNGIAPALLAAADEAPAVWARVARVVAGSEAWFAQNVEFDRRFVVGGPTTWIDSYDLAWPKAHRPRMSLAPLALAHGLGVSHAHRAAVDVDLLGRLLTRVAEMGTDLQAFLARGLRPKGSFVSLAPFEEKDAVKAAGFVWEPKAKLWTMRMAYDDVAALPFKVREVTP